MLVGRCTERKAIERLLAGVRAGRSGVLVVSGAAGTGKTALLDHAHDVASGCRVERFTGVETEREFAYAGLHQVHAPWRDRLDALPPPQRAALEVAFGLRAGGPPDRFLVGLATWGVLAQLAAEQPLLCLVDDAQWWDAASAQAMAFVARRVATERLGLVFALRDPHPGDVRAFAGLPTEVVGGLGEADARELLARVVRAPLDERVRDRVIAEARGNPLALTELSPGAEPARLAGGFGPPDAWRVPRRVEESVRCRSHGLPAETRLLLLTAAAEPLGDPALLWAAAGHLGLGAAAAAPAEEAGLWEVGTRVRFHHPLARSAVYRAAAPVDRRRVHRALAAATDPWAEPDRHAWHRAQAALGADEGIAADLERAAGRARARGGLAATAAFLERAVTLTPAPADRARRALSAAQAKHGAGAPDAARELLTLAQSGPLPALARARVKLLDAEIAWHTTRHDGVPAQLLAAARELAPLDAALARDTYLHALVAAPLAGTAGRAVLEVADAGRTAPPAPMPPRAADLLLDGLASRTVQGYEACAPTLKRALTALVSHASERHRAAGWARADDDGGRWLGLGCRVAVALWDDEALCTLATRAVDLARTTGALAALPAALHALAVVRVLTGDFAQAAELNAEAAVYRQPPGLAPLPDGDVLLAAWRGQQHLAHQLQATALQVAGPGEGVTVTPAPYALAVLHNSLGNYDAALAAAAPPCEGDELAHSSMALPELIEAAVRADRPDRAGTALKLLDSRAQASGTPWALGLAARSRALLSTGRAAEEAYREAVERLGHCRMVPHLARAHLLYGEWLRRERRRHDARTHLRTAHRMLTDMGAQGFAARAAHELRATGERPRRQTAEPAGALTAHELHIARLVATGATSKEVGAQLFLSPRTIDAHLRSIFRKLRITSRRQLRELPLH
ncbi:LuxR family transcriptional regulator [Streptomyces sp. HSW2009]|uniref:ATP-binding protein n=1 Tax=Streptomyces sp. HSW2009 TaxID=3142890 RepID=UPI0032EF393D